ncbi:MAG: hypothetical protein NC483_06820 [Ruminococcus sp.]|nr:hypothetical protein [Ruminococcus sp.]
MTAVNVVPTSDVVVTYVNLDLIRKFQSENKKVAVREYTGKRLDPTKRSTLICFGGKRVAKKTFNFEELKSSILKPYQPKRAMKKHHYYLNNVSSFINSIKFKKAKRAEKVDYSSIISTKLASLENNLKVFGRSAKTKAIKLIKDIKNSDDLALFQIQVNYFIKSFQKQAKIAQIKLEKLSLNFKKNYLALMSKIYTSINANKTGKRTKRGKNLAVSLSCVGLAFLLTVTSLASFKKMDKTSKEFPTEPKDYVGLLEGDIPTVKPDLLARVDLESEVVHYAELADLENKSLQERLEGTTTDLEEEIEEVEILDLEATPEPVVVEQEEPAISISANSNITLTDNSANSNLVYFNPNDFYRCPDSVTTEQLLDIFGITPDQFYNTVYGIFCSESAVSYNGYNEMYVCFYTDLNRICSPNWVNSHGTNIYKQAIAPNQYVVYQNGTYTSYKNYSDETRSIALTAIRDAMYNFIVDPSNRPHSWTSFRSNGTTSYSNNLFTPGGNRYAGTMSEVVYPEFLDSEAAVALRNTALGITPVAPVEEPLYEEPYVELYTAGESDLAIQEYTIGGQTFISGDETLYPDLDMTLNRTLN